MNSLEIHLTAFFERTKANTPEITWIKVSDAQEKKPPPTFTWARNPGVYVIVTSSQVEYVGKIDSAGLYFRIHQHVETGGALEWDEMLESPSTRIAVIPLLDDLSVWIPSLEVYLIDKLKPFWNKRKG